LLAVLAWSYLKGHKADATISTKRMRTLGYWASLQAYRDKKPFGEPIKLTGDVAGETFFNADDGIRFFATSSDDGHLYLLNEEASGKYNLLFPSPEANNKSSEVKANLNVATSECNFDAKSGTEKVWIIWSVSPIEELEKSVLLWGNLHDQGEVKEPRTADAINKFLAEHSGTRLRTEPDIENGRMILRGEGDVIVYQLKLIHR